MTLEEKRAQIDKIDHEIIDLLKVRIETSREIGAIKKEMNIPLLDKGRYDKLLQDRITQGVSGGIPKEVIVQIWNSIHQWSLMVQRNV
mgnify:CR=1 FL=1